MTRHASGLNGSREDGLSTSQREERIGLERGKEREVERVVKRRAIQEEGRTSLGDQAAIEEITGGVDVVRDGDDVIGEGLGGRACGLARAEALGGFGDEVLGGFGEGKGLILHGVLVVSVKLGALRAGRAAGTLARGRILVRRFVTRVGGNFGRANSRCLRRW